MLDKWDWFKIFCTSSIYSVPVQKKLYQRKKLYYKIYTTHMQRFNFHNSETYVGSRTLEQME